MMGGVALEKPIIPEIVASLRALTEPSIPGNVLNKAAFSLVDLAECVYDCDNSDSRLTSAMESVETSADAPCEIWGTDLRAGIADAAFVNALRGALSYRNSLHRASGTHPVEIVAAAVRSAAAKCRADAADQVAGYVWGIEICARAGCALRLAGLPSANRSTALVAAMAAAAAAGRTLRMDNASMVSALSFATHMASGNNQWGIDGTGEDVFQAGWGARNGLYAALLARSGARGSAWALDGPGGMLACHGVTLTPEMRDALLDSRYSILELESKPIAACLMTQTPAQMIDKRLRRRAIDPSEIDRIVIEVSRQAKNQPGCDSLRVDNIVQAKMNIRYVVSSLLNRSQIQGIRWSPPYDSRILELMQKCELVENAEYARRFPRKVSSGMRIFYADGTEERLEQEDFVSLSNDALIQRYYDTVSSKASREKAEQIIRNIYDTFEMEE